MCFACNELRLEMKRNNLSHKILPHVSTYQCRNVAFFPFPKLKIKDYICFLTFHHATDQWSRMCQSCPTKVCRMCHLDYKQDQKSPKKSSSKKKVCESRYKSTIGKSRHVLSVQAREQKGAPGQTLNTKLPACTSAQRRSSMKRQNVTSEPHLPFSLCPVTYPVCTPIIPGRTWICSASFFRGDIKWMWSVTSNFACRHQRQLEETSFTVCTSASSRSHTSWEMFLRLQLVELILLLQRSLWLHLSCMTCYDHLKDS